MKISLIAAVSKNGVIGNGGAIPWHLPNDFKRFREKTLGHHVIMGRKTWISIGRPLPKRVNVVVSSKNESSCQHPSHYPGGKDIVVSKSIISALTIAKNNGDNEAFIIGGSRIYSESLRYAHNIYLTLVHQYFDGDAFFPYFSDDLWKEQYRKFNPSDDLNKFPHSFIHYCRNPESLSLNFKYKGESAASAIIRQGGI